MSEPWDNPFPKPAAPYGTAEYQRQFSLGTGWPYGAELTYKHPYWWDKTYHALWDVWRAAGGADEEPACPEWIERK